MSSLQPGGLVDSLGDLLTATAHVLPVLLCSSPTACCAHTGSNRAAVSTTCLEWLALATVAGQVCATNPQPATDSRLAALTLSHIQAHDSSKADVQTGETAWHPLCALPLSSPCSSAAPQHLGPPITTADHQPEGSTSLPAAALALTEAHGILLPVQSLQACSTHAAGLTTSLKELHSPCP